MSLGRHTRETLDALLEAARSTVRLYHAAARGEPCPSPDDASTVEFFGHLRTQVAQGAPARALSERSELAFECTPDIEVAALTPFAEAAAAVSPAVQLRAEPYRVSGELVLRVSVEFHAQRDPVWNPQGAV